MDSHTHFGVQLITALPLFAGLPRDRLIVRVGHPEPITLVRSLPANYAAICDALAVGLVLPLGSQLRVDTIIAALSRLQQEGSWPAPAVPRSGSRPDRWRVPHLRLEVP